MFMGIIIVTITIIITGIIAGLITDIIMRIIITRTIITEITMRPITTIENHRIPTGYIPKGKRPDIGGAF